MKPQEIVNKVWDHFITMGQPKSVNRITSRGPFCVYRDPDGNKCAVGVLIPDFLYEKEMEVGNISGVFRDFPNVAKYLGEDNQILLSRLQNVHDWEINWHEGKLREEPLIKLIKNI